MTQPVDTRSDSKVDGNAFRTSHGPARVVMSVATIAETLRGKAMERHCKDLRYFQVIERTLGAKVEHNVYSGYDFLPSVRIAWKPAPERLIWSAVSRAVRAPSPAP